MYNSKLVLSLFFCFIAVMAVSQTKINWMTWEEAIEASKVEKRKIFIDVYTDWCGWCKKMDKNTFRKEHIAQYVNEHYYPIKFNAETRDQIELHGKKYNFVGSGRRGYHELAAEILKGKMSYPTIVFLNEEFKLIQPIAGYQDAKNFELIMTYFGGDYHQTMPWKRYVSSYKSNLLVPASNN